MAIDSRDDIETTILLLIAGLIVGTLAASGRTARHRADEAGSEIRRIHRVAEAVASGGKPADVIAVAQDELRELLTLTVSRFESQPYSDETIRLALGPYWGDRSSTGAALQPARRQRRVRVASRRRRRAGPGARRGDRSVRAHPHTGTPTTLESRMVAVAIADQVGNVWMSTPAGVSILMRRADVRSEPVLAARRLASRIW